jgi:hypothetical protein
MDEFPTQATLNILPLGLYDLLIGMDWLATYKARLDCYHKTLECVSDEGRRCLGPIIIGDSILQLLIWRFSLDDEVWLG